MISQWDAYNLSKLSSYAEQGWVFADIGIPGQRSLVHPDRDCTLTNCPQAGTSHRHQPTEAEREEMDRYITRWLQYKYEKSLEENGRIQDCRELKRLYSLEDPRESTPSDADLRSIDECCPAQTDLAPYYRRLRYRLDCGREVDVEGVYVSPSTLGYLEGSKERIRDPIIKRLPERAREQFPGISGLFIKPVPEGELPLYTFIVDLVCYQPVSDPNNDMSMLTVCWLGDDIETSLPELIDREISSVEWDKYAVDGNV